MKNLFRHVALLLAVCALMRLEAQTPVLLYDAVAKGNAMSKIAGSQSYTFNANGCVTANGALTVGANMPYISGLNQPQGGGAAEAGFTAFMVVSEIPTSSSDQCLFDIWGAGNWKLGVYLNRDFKFKGSLYSNTDALQSNQYGPTTLALNKSHDLHVVTVVNRRADAKPAGPSTRFFVDGQMYGSWSGCQTNQNTNALFLGGHKSGTALTGQGTGVMSGMKIHRVVIYSNQVSDADINSYSAAIKTGLEYDKISSITVTSDANGSAMINGGSTNLTDVVFGTSISLSATPPLSFVKWVNADDVATILSMENPYTFASTKPLNVKAIFADGTTKVVTVNAGEGGQTSISGTKTYPIGDAIEITATPIAGYQFVKWVNATSGSDVDIAGAILPTYEYTGAGSIIIKALFEIAPLKEGKWYYIKSGNPADPYKGSGLFSTGQNTQPQWDIVQSNFKYMWRLEKHASNNTYKLINGAYNVGSLNASSPPHYSTGNTYYSIDKYIGTNNGIQYKVFSGSTTLHAQLNGKALVSWTSSDAYNGSSAWIFEEVSEAALNQETAIYDITATQCRTSTGIGNKNYPLLLLETLVQGVVGHVKLSEITINLTGTTDINDIEKMYIYKTTNSYRFKEAQSQLVKSFDAATGNITVSFDEPIEMDWGASNFFLTLDVSGNAKEGNLIDARVISCKDEKGNSIVSTNGNPQFAATIFKTAATVLTCGDWDSKYYRIPGIITADNGTLVAVADKRIGHNGDLPANIDLVANWSDDNGKTWSDPITIHGVGDNIGYGDPAILKNKNGRLICLYNGGQIGLWNSTPENPFRKFKSHSDDNGRSWSTPVDITSQLYSSVNPDPVAASWTSMLLSSGGGLTLRDGTMMVAVATTTTTAAGGKFPNYIAYSTDDGDTWKCETGSPAHPTLGDEAKLVELADGDIMISIRAPGGRRFNTTTNRGKSWKTSSPTSSTSITAVGNGCNGDFIRYTAIQDGFNKNRLLHSIPDATSRVNVSVYMSTDEGVSFPIKRSICASASAYSALTILKNGDIGCYYEDGGENMDQVFVSFSLDWLSAGADSDPKLTAIGGETGDRTPTEQSFKAWSDRGVIRSNRTEDAFSVYNAMGVKLSIDGRLSTGVYFVKSANDVCAVVIP